MCQKVVINKAEKTTEIERIGDLFQHFNPKSRLSSVSNACLCAVDLDKFLEQRKISYKRIDGDYYIGQLESINEFDYECVL